uniref:Queuosine-tRNA galactosyltransferase isoform X2 n=1 Tax=Pogona vitticeps TaxID=103695 RepID=A0A6J0SYW0_9SAUR
MEGTEMVSEAPTSLPLFLGEDIYAGDPALPKSKNPATPSLDRPGLLPFAPLSREVRENSRIQVSVILPVYNAESWLDECLQSVLDQDFQGSIELSVFNDSSTDNSVHMIQKWKVHLEEAGIRVVLGGNYSSQPRGVGFAKNHAVDQSSGMYLCFLDSDDVMMPQRIRLQWEAAIQHPNCIIGCQIRREPVEATERYTRWINSLTEEQLLTQENTRYEEKSKSLHHGSFMDQSEEQFQIFTSHGPTVIMPTWFCSREWFCHLGRFDEGGKGTPEDLLFFYEHIRKGGGVFRVNKCLLLYRYHLQAATHSVLESTIWTHRVLFLEERILNHWTGFTIWNAGKQGRKLFRSLSSANQKKVEAFCDVDENKIAKGFYTYEESKENPKPKIPILHFKDASPPFIICMKLDLTDGQFEDNLNMLKLKEGVDYFHFN